MSTNSVFSLNSMKSPLVRISLGLVMLTCCLLLMFEFLGLFPDPKSSELQYRKVLVESLAIQLNSDIVDQRYNNVSTTLANLVERNPDVKSAALRLSEGELLIQHGNHNADWQLSPASPSTPTQVQVSVFRGNQPLANIEVSFKELSVSTPFYLIVLLLGGIGFACYLLFLKRAMLELDPSSVVPDRVGNALNTFSEGLIIVDNKERIVFINNSFLENSGYSKEFLIGKKASALDWILPPEETESNELPWTMVMKGKRLSGETDLKFRSRTGKYFSYKVNVSPIGDNAAVTRGALITLNDITELELKNGELNKLLNKLKHGQKEIAAQNRELKYLATRDPLTACLNRRSFFEGFNILLTESAKHQSPITCIMLDIDHFKSVNDNYGHAIGDIVIKMVASTLRKISRPNDLVGRYGGEEFCVVLPHTPTEKSVIVAERMRKVIEETEITTPSGEFTVTASFGICGTSGERGDSQAMVSKADEALYHAKENGRNRVCVWSSEEHSLEMPDAAHLTADSAIQAVNTLPEGVTPLTVMSDEPATPSGLSNERFNINPFEEDALHESALEPINLPGRSLILDRITQAIERAKRSNQKCALLVLDLDKAQKITNTMGHASAESLLKQTATKLSSTFRTGDSLAIVDMAEFSFSLSQISSYEFAILLADFEQDEVVANTINRIFKILEQPIVVEGKELYLDSHIGVSIFPNDGEGAEELLGNASSAMHEAKLMQGRYNFRYFSAEINMKANQQLKTENDLHRAVDRGEFTVYYQPKVDLRSGDVCGMEALIRWQHPELGLIAPNDFIPLAETNGIIESISSYVISTVCQQLQSWQEEGLAIVPIAVNLSPSEFRNRRLAQRIISLVESYDILPEFIELEITENVAFDNLGGTIDLITELNSAGVSVALDDFGTGYCTYSYLKHFSPDKLKIDRSIISGFTDNTFDAAIVNSIITLGEHLGVNIIAEGVETEEQLNFLRDLRCHQIQGYYISKPVPSEEATKFLSDPMITRKLICGDFATGHYSELSAEPGKLAELTGTLNRYRG